jgi:hypothetical protein
MHDTAFQIGGLVIDFYCPKGSSSILEVGSLDVNGSLRHHAPEVDRYIGLDFAMGAGVDHVINDKEPWPVEDGSFDLVMASSVLEHDPHFWETFVHMVRKTRPGGYIYLNAPSNGWVHRYPTDCWRFYPDSAAALAQWAGSQGFAVTLVESFTASRAADVWNDWCAIFRREPSLESLPDRMIHDRISCKNVVCWKSEGILHFDEQPEDMTIIAKQHDAQQAAETRIAAMQFELEEAKRLEQQLSSRVALLETEVSIKSTELHDLEQVRASEADTAEQRERTLLRGHSTLEVEVMRLRKKVEADTKAIDALNAAKKELKACLAKAKTEATSAKSMLLNERLNSAEIERTSQNREVLVLEDLRKALREKLEIEQQLRRATRELSQFANLLRSATDDRARIAERIDWLLAVLNVVDSASRSWALLPARQRRNKLIAGLSRRGLFNGAAYLQRYPDVAASEMDSLTHYLRHGINEGREISDLEKPA